jgi:hypothetical protein
MTELLPFPPGRVTLAHRADMHDRLTTRIASRDLEPLHAS